MTRYEVTLTEKALADMAAIYDHTACVLQAPETAMRQLAIDHYSAIYVVGGERVTVLRVLYSASDVAARLREP